MEFQSLLLKADYGLKQKEVRALVFLCTDLLGRATAVDSAKALFARLCDQDYLSEEQPHLLSELLSIINRPRLIRDLGLSSSVPPRPISAYRKLLYQMSEELTENDVNSIKFLLVKYLPRNKLQDNVTLLEVFMELEDMELISETKLDLLESIIQQVCPVLMEKICQFKAQNSASGRSIAQETGQQSFQPPYPQTSQVPRPSAGEAGLRAPLQALQLRSVNNSPNEPEPGPSEWTGSHTERSSWQIDASPSVQEENQTFSRTEASVTNNANAGLETYPMTTQQRGCCFIINNYDFGEKKREGTQVDEDCLKTVFSWLGFQVEVQRDCTSERILSLMEELAGRSQQDWDCVVCCVLSHGLEGCVHGVDYKPVNIKMLLEPFIGTKCPSMAGKPKLFFIQACQGIEEQGIVYLGGDRPEHSDVDTDVLLLKESIPSHSDFLLGMSTVPGFVSLRERTNGTWYIQSLCQNLVDMVPSGADLMSILTKVNADVSKQTDGSGSRKQMPQPAFTVTKKIVFPVPSGQRPDLSKIKDRYKNLKNYGHTHIL